MAVISIVAPVYNEELCLEEFYRQLINVIDGIRHDFVFVFVDDGSTDGSYKVLKRIQEGDYRVRAIRLSRNFGHQAAIKCGLDNAVGGAVITMDSDLQDPPRFIPDMIKAWENGYRIVNTMRFSRSCDSWFKRVTAIWYYKLFNLFSGVKLVEGSADFKLLDRCVVDIICKVQTGPLFIRGLVAWYGGDQINIWCERDRRYDGQPKYTLWKMLKYAWAGLQFRWANKPYYIVEGE